MEGILILFIMKERLKYRKIKKKILIFILFYFLFKVVGWFIPRSEEKMKELAYEEIEDYIKYDVKDETILKKLRGPLKNVKENKITFCWYYVTEWGDTAEICARVYKTILSAREDYKDWLKISGTYSHPQISMNYEWYYLLFEDRGTSAPLNLNKNMKLILIRDSLECIGKIETLELLKDTNIIYYILNKGYYITIKDYKNYISTKTKLYKDIKFYDLVFKVKYKSEKQKELSFSTAKIFLKNDTVYLAPYDYYDICK
ncbi:MAG: hypothetical protein KatS3mg087_2003 [Patescibacteria group bacterium]|nr:MAG: hypothetical protein KatS3mg087_2003 [Patescibacteria group bacterium]